VFGDGGPPLVGEKFGVEFGVPKDRNGFTLGIVVDAGETQGAKSLDRRSILDQPAPRSKADEIPR
jgi:hypothetical protein